MDPLSAVAGSAALISSVGTLASTVSTLQKRYPNVGLNVTLLASSLATVEELLRGMQEARALVERASSFEQLDRDVGLALESCALLVVVVGRKLRAASLETRAVLDRLRFLQLDAALKDDVCSWDGQIRALQLLRTILQCKSTTEQKARLANEGSRSVLENAKRQIILLGLTDGDLDAAAAMLRNDSAVEPILDADAAIHHKDRPRHSLQYYPISTPSLRPEPLSISKASKSNPRKGSASSISRSTDAFMTHHGGLPFLGIPFHGEQEEALDFESVEEEHGEAEKTATVAGRRAKAEEMATVPETMATPTPSQKQDDIQGSAKSAYITIFMDVEKSETEVDDDVFREKNHRDENAPRGDEFGQRAMPPRSIASRHAQNDIGRGLGLLMQEHGDVGAKSIKVDLDDMTEEELLDLVDSAKPYPLPLPKRGSSLDCLLKLAPGALEGSSSVIPTAPTSRSHGDRREAQSPVEKSASPLQVAHEMANASTSPRSIGATSLFREDAASTQMLDDRRLLGSPTVMDHQIKAPATSEDSYDINFGPSPELSISPPRISQAAPSAKPAFSTTTGPSRLRELAQATRKMAPSDDGPHPGSRIPDALLPDIPIHDAAIGQITHRRSFSTTSIPSRPSTPPKQPSKERRDGPKSPISKQLSQFLPLASHGRQKSQNRIPRRPVPSGSGASTGSRDSSNHDAGRVARKPDLSRARAASSDRPRQSGDAGLRNLSSLDAPTSRSSTSSDPVDASMYTTPNRSSSPTTSASSAAQSVTATALGASAMLEAGSLSSVDEMHSAEPREARSKGGKSATKEAIVKSIAIMQGKYASSSLETFKMGKIKLPRLSALSSILSTSDKTSPERAISVAEAASSGNTERLKILLQDNSRVVDTWTTQGAEVAPRTPVMRAATADSVGCLELLRAFGADFDVSDSLGRSLLHLAVQKGCMQAVEWLVALPLKDGSRRCAMAERPDIQGLRPLHVAAGNGLADMIDILIESGANIEPRDQQARTPLLYAIAKGQHETAAYLVAHGCNIEARDLNMETPLIAASKANLLEAIRLLLERGANREARDNDGETAIHHAARLGHRDAIDIIHNDLTQLEAENGLGERPLHLACSTAQLHIVKLLLEQRVQVDAMSIPVAPLSAVQQPIAATSNSAGKLSSTLLPSTPLHYACMFAKVDLVAVLIAAGASVNMPQDDGGLTPLMLASERGNTDIAQCLLDAGTNVNASSTSERLTALQIATMRNHLPMSRLLIAHGADISAQTSASDPHAEPAALHNATDATSSAQSTSTADARTARKPDVGAFVSTAPAYPTSNGQIPLLPWMNPTSRPGMAAMPWLLPPSLPPPQPPTLGSGLGLDGIAYRGFFHSGKPSVVLGMDGAVEVPLPSLVGEAGVGKFSAG